jgi:hypothetical protein
MIFGSGPDCSSTGLKPVAVVLFHSGFLPPTLLAGRARRVPSLSPGRNVTRVGRRAFVKPVSFDGNMFFVSGPVVLSSHVVIVDFGSAGAVNVAVVVESVTASASGSSNLGSTPLRK